MSQMAREAAQAPEAVARFLQHNDGVLKETEARLRQRPPPAIRTSGATANLGTGMLFNAFAAVVIGGVSLKGGVGQLPGVHAGVLLDTVKLSIRQRLA